MVVADLHVHTDNSDGSLPLAAVPGVARAAGLEAVAVTDHDRLHPDLSTPITEREGVTLVHGIELRVSAGDQRVDLLGYGATRTPALVDEIDRLQADRIDRARRMVSCLEDRLDRSLDVDFVPGIGRPHVARAAVEACPDRSVGDIFAEFIGEGKPCYVARAVPDFADGRAVLAEACHLVGLAHPLRYDDPEAALALTASLDAVERWYPYADEVDPTAVDGAIDRHGLLPTGGSDAHGRTLGDAGLDREPYRRVAPALGIDTGDGRPPS